MGRTRQIVRVITTVAAIILLPPVIYIGSYMALLDPSPQFVEPEKGWFVFRSVRFRAGGDAAHFVFYPLIELDYEIRPEFWADLSPKGKFYYGGKKSK
jgi:hypothetical protein